MTTRKTCRNGHPRSTVNTYTDGKGRTICRVCVRDKAASRYAREFRGTNEHRVVRSAVDRQEA